METIDVAIVGGGAAGLATAQYAARAALRAVVFEQTGTGGQCTQIIDLENYPGLNGPVSGEEFTERFERQARNFGAQIRLERVRSLEPSNGAFIVTTDEQRYNARAVILATGARHRELGAPGERDLRGRGVSYCATCDGPMFAGKPMVVVGGGDAACDEAMFLSKLSDRIILVHRRDRFRAQKALAQRVMENDRIDVRFTTEVESIHGAPNQYGIDVVDHVVLRSTTDERREDVPVAAVFVFVGSIPRTDLVPFAETDHAGYLVTDATMATSVPGLFAIGDVRNTPFRQLVVAASDGAIAAHSVSAFIDARYPA